MGNQKEPVKLKLRIHQMCPWVTTVALYGRVMSPETLSLTYTDGIWDKRYGIMALGSHFGKPKSGLQLGNQILLL